jgi:predicted Rossmann-fold nucleotide-binding protein
MDASVNSEPQEPTFDQELLSLLGAESPEVLAHDSELVREIASEFANGFNALSAIGPAVTIFGSARTDAGHPSYALTRSVARALGQAGYAIITGGGPGLMEAANRGARDAGAISVGCNIELPHEQGLNQYVDVPAILMGDGEWDGLIGWLEQRALADGRIAARDLQRVKLTSDPQAIVEIIDQSVREAHREQD